MQSELNHNEVVFRVLLQREEFRSNLTFAKLEEAVPKALLQTIEGDWRLFIRDEGLEFDAAFQKAIRKHIPGLHFIILAAEFLSKIPFHIALGHFLRPDKFKWSAALSEEDVFKLADRLEDEFRRQRARFIPPQKKIFALPKFTPEPSKPTRRCYFCGKRIPSAELYKHIDSVHLNPSHLGGLSNQPNNPSPSFPPKPELTVQTKPVITDDSFPYEARNLRRASCACGNIAIPGDFYCYGCAPD